MPVSEAAQVDVEQALYRQLGLMTEVVALVASTPTGPAISPVNAAQRATLPRVTYQLVSDEPVQFLKGECGEKVAVFHVKTWADNPKEANDLAKAIAGRRANPRLANFTWQDGLLGGILRVARVKVSDRASEVEQPVQGDEPGEYWRLLVVVVQYSDPNEGP